MGPRQWSSIAVVAVSLLVGASAVAQGPAWVGTSGVGVRVEDRDGRKLEGAEVRLTYSEGEGGGPAPVLTGADGRAEVPGLTPGEWVLSIRHPETMAYVATLMVRENRKPKEIAASQVKVGESLRSLRIDYFEVSGPPAQPPAPPTPEPAPAPEERPSRPPPPEPDPEPEPAPRPETGPEPEAEEPSEERPEPAPDEPVATPPAEAPEEAPAETPEQRPAPAPEPTPEPAPERPEPVPEPETPAAPVAEAEPTPEPEPAAPEPEPPSEPESVSQPPAREPSAAPPRQITLRSEASGTCPECQPGEWAVSAQGVAAPEGTLCPGDLEERIRKAAGLLGASRALGPWAGPIDLAGGASSVLGSAAYREFTQALRSVLADDASCRALAVMLPSGSRFVGFRYEAADGDAWVRCLPEQDCPGAGQRWTSNPTLARTPAGMVVAGAFLNAGAERRPVRLTVFFSPPDGWKPR